MVLQASDPREDPCPFLLVRGFCIDRRAERWSRGGSQASGQRAWLTQPLPPAYLRVLETDRSRKAQNLTPL